jgi:hypothetical protein
MAIQVRGGLSAPMIALDWGMTVPRRHAKPDGRDGDETQIRKFCCRVRELQSSRSSANQTLGTTRTSTPRPQPTTAAAATPSSATSTPVPAVSSATSATSSTLPLDECLHSRQPDHPPGREEDLPRARLLRRANQRLFDARGGDAAGDEDRRGYRPQVSAGDGWQLCFCRAGSSDKISDLVTTRRARLLALSPPCIFLDPWRLVGAGWG